VELQVVGWARFGAVDVAICGRTNRSIEFVESISYCLVVLNPLALDLVKEVVNKSNDKHSISSYRFREIAMLPIVSLYISF
jgi:hypothetical protein